MPVAADPFPRKVEVRRGRRRGVLLTLEKGRFVVRIPERAREGARLDRVIAELRGQLWARMRDESVWTDPDLRLMARRVADEYLSDRELPQWDVRFSRRQHKRWGSCTSDGKRGQVRISAHLMGHPRWVIAEILLHELAHLVVPDHGPLFQSLVRRSPGHDRGQGYLEALESVERLGPSLSGQFDIEEDAQATLFAVD